MTEMVLISEATRLQEELERRKVAALAHIPQGWTSIDQVGSALGVMLEDKDWQLKLPSQIANELAIDLPLLATLLVNSIEHKDLPSPCFSIEHDQLFAIMAPDTVVEVSLVSQSHHYGGHISTSPASRAIQANKKIYWIRWNSLCSLEWELESLATTVEGGMDTAVFRPRVRWNSQMGSWELRELFGPDYATTDYACVLGLEPVTVSYPSR